MGADRMVFGSDWPHTKGLPHPQDTFFDAPDVGDPEQQKGILRNNAFVLNQRRTA